MKSFETTAALGGEPWAGYKALVASIAACRWVLSRLLASSWIVFAAAFLLLVIPFQQALSPLPTPQSALALGQLWAQPASSLGILAGMAVLSGGEAFLARLDRPSRRGAELAAMAVAGMLLLLPTFAGVLLAGAALDRVASLGLAILTVVLHLASAAQLLLHPALSVALRVPLFLLLVWVPAPLCASGACPRSIAALFDAYGPLLAPGPESLGSSMAATAALLLAGHLVRR